jgi:hypothetical protein
MPACHGQCIGLGVQGIGEWSFHIVACGDEDIIRTSANAGVCSDHQLKTPDNFAHSASNAQFKGGLHRKFAGLG